MDRQLLERMVGAGVLILALVILGPMVLDGDGGESSVDIEQEEIPGQRSEELRTHTVQLNEPSPAAPPPPASSPTANSLPESAATVTQRPPAAVPRDASASGSPPIAKQPARIESRPKPVAGPAISQPPSSRGWLVQIGTFGQKQNAERLVARLKEGDFAAFVSPVSRGGKTLYRVRVGDAGTREAASILASQLAAAGHAGQVVTE